MVKFLLLFSSTLLLLGQTEDSEVKDYSGPSILSRGGAASSIGKALDVSFRPYVGISGVYQTDFTGVVPNSSGGPQNVDSYGIQLNFGVYGLHHFRRGILGINYNGNIQHYPRNRFADGIDQMLSLQFSHQLTKRWAFTLNEMAGTYTRNYNYSNGGGLIDPQAFVLPTADLFDNRVFYLQTMGGLTYRASARLSFNMSGGGFLTRRRSTALFGVTGGIAAGDASYRLTRVVTVSAVYGYQHYGFNHAFGASDIHMAGLSLAARISRSWELALEGGGARVESLFLSSVPIDPVIAAITGQSAGIQATYNVRYVPSTRVRLTRQMRRATATVSYEQGVTPGNGVYLTSRQENAAATISISGQRHWHFSGSVGYYRLHALTQSIGANEGYQGGLGVSRDVFRSLQWALRADLRHDSTHFAGFHRNSAYITMGFYWSPGDVPLKLW